ncbi:hypothetical protein NE237_021814 [Protea cynaroides]|uniref:Mitochondrial protein n=1 Tax=Protea cynaroides TaxID=273540 RepID=A0A9Q0H9V2_9MAGN|nr:hypothetical protein NE237_021814 [Protea cynaroides]
MLITRRYGRARKTKEAVETFEKMEKFGTKPELSDFNRFIDTLSNSRHVKNAQEDSKWFPDIGATTHMTDNGGKLHNLSPYVGTDAIMVGNGEKVPITHIGEGTINSKTSTLPLSKIKHSQTQKVLASGIKKDGMYSFDVQGTAEQNGIVERKHKHVVELGLAMMYHAAIPRSPTSPCYVNPVSSSFDEPNGNPPYPSSPLVSTQLSHEPLLPTSLENLVTDLNSPPTNTHRMVTQGKDGIQKPNPKYALVSSSIPTEPTSVKAALTHPGWFPAMQDEMNSLAYNNTWTLIPPTPEMNIAGYRWIFKTKRHD